MCVLCLLRYRLLDTLWGHSVGGKHESELVCVCVGIAALELRASMCYAPSHLVPARVCMVCVT